MTTDLYPLQVLLVTLAGWVNRHQQHVIEYLVEENRVLKAQVKGRRLRFTDDQRRRLAGKGRRLGRRVLRQGATIVTADTIRDGTGSGSPGSGRSRRSGQAAPGSCRRSRRSFCGWPRRIRGGATRTSKGRSRTWATKWRGLPSPKC